MKIRLLKKDYIQSESAFNDFKKKIEINEEYFTDESIEVDGLVNFKIYFGKDYNEKDADFKAAIKCVQENYLSLGQDILMEPDFWYTLFLVHMREDIIIDYPSCCEDIKKFRNIVLKPFNWESYVYKMIFAAQYTSDYNDDSYIDLIISNLDIYNYMLKSKIFRNPDFIKKTLDVINNNKISKIVKGKIKNYEELGIGKDERYGRRVIYEFNKSYPVVLSPMLSYKTFESYFMEYLSFYYNDHSAIVSEQAQ